MVKLAWHSGLPSASQIVPTGSIIVSTPNVLPAGIGRFRWRKSENLECDEVALAKDFCDEEFLDVIS